MLNVLINGCNGAMGQVLSKEISNLDDIEVLAGIDRYPNLYDNPYPVYEKISQCKETVDIIIDFSHPVYIDDLLAYGTENNIPLVIATTGLSDKNLKDIKKASEKIPIFYSSNMSLGINVLINLAKKAGLILKDDFDIEIIEKHHNKKIDAPSGTAYMIANEINQELDNSKTFIFGRHTKTDKRQSNEIGIHAIRGGTIAGEHTILFAGNDEVIELKHTASSKKVFAMGAIKAARYIQNKEYGYYTMDDLLN
ncbi:4-hydroxy-tetrahydrodipicolinate reductase [Clostridiisalibacter paucivorans]|uniref:4-hydroxy-tetrahydrodipicolinate reductase n=1 Tax=Clostridiisalibacter paucivorans TaxID=408753 RepID=UPI00047A586E|nr:4-hydroxy-tetrahydrodipicolinate reductase [Clostridiisalibacter paucivorans]